MCAWVIELNCAIAPHSHNHAVLDNYSTYWNFSGLLSLDCLANSQGHEVLVRVSQSIHGFVANL
ncbi:hypothetical protein MCEMSEM22_01900 [Comamonadaceae bacterium]